MKTKNILEIIGEIALASVWAGFIFYVFGLAAGPARADWSVVAGAGQGNFAWCGGRGEQSNGGWHQETLPYSDSRQTGTYLLGVRYNVSPNFAVDGLYHTWTDATASGTFVEDADYSPTTRQVRAGARTYYASMRTKTDGISLSAVPIAHFGQTRIFGRAGMVLYRQSTEFSYGTNTTPALREAGRAYTWLLGAGIGQDFKRWTVSAEILAFQQVKVMESPVGGDWANDKSFGLVNYMLTVGYHI